jgi:hypothetical protein
MEAKPERHFEMAAGLSILPDGKSCSNPAGMCSRDVVKLQIFTLAWMSIECGVSLWSAWRSRSPVLLAFGSDSFVELLSATVVLLQFTPAFTLSPARAARIAGILLFTLGAIVVLSSLTTVITGVEPDTSWSGVLIALAALAIMPVLSRAKRRSAKVSHDRALAADAVQSATCAYLAAITLGGLAANAIFHISWIDPVAALIAVPILCIEGRRALRGEVCACC